MNPQLPAQMVKPQEKPEDQQKAEPSIKKMETELAQMKEEVAKIELQIKIGEINRKSLEAFVECNTFEDFLQSVKETTAQLKAVLPPPPGSPKNS